MHISLKKQIHVTKISKNFKTADIILFFAMFDLPQKNRQLIKKGNTEILHLSKIYNLSKDSFLSRAENLKLTHNVPLPVNLTPDSAKQPLNFNICVQSLCELSRPYPYFAKNNILHINNKCIQHLDQCYGLPFSGQTYMFAVQNEEHAHYMFTSAKYLHKGIFLGGFYKDKYKNNIDLKALCIAISQKKDRYINLFRCSFTLYKNFCITSQICYKLLILTLYKMSLQKKAKKVALKIN